MPTTELRACLLASVATVSMLAMPAAALAQDRPASAAAEEGTIIVTARKRDENLQDVPLSVTAFSEAQLAASGIENVNDLANQTPGLSFKSAFGRNFDRPVIRGMSSIQGAPNAAFFIDGIYVSGPISGYNLDDLERVEIIKGPQSALFGRSTFSGAINYITRKPDNDFRGRASATLGTDGLREASGTISFPIVRDILYAQADARLYDFGGQYNNIADPVERLGRERSRSFSGTIRLTPSSDTDIVARIGFAQDNDGFVAATRIGRIPGQVLPVANQLLFQGVDCFLPQFSGVITSGRPTATTRTRGYLCGEIGQPNSYGANSAEFRAAGFADAIDRSIFRASLQINQKLGDWLVTGVAGYNYRDQIIAFDQDYSDVRSLGRETFVREGGKDKTFELKLASPTAARVRAVLGGYYFKDEDNAKNYSGVLAVPSGATNRPFVAGDDPSLVARNPVSLNSVENYAIFGLVEADLTDRLTVGAEGRYQIETIGLVGTSTARVGTTTFTRAINQSIQYKTFLPRVTVDYDLTDDAMVYAVVAKGNKPGGFNANSFDAIFDDAEVARFAALGFNAFREENVWSYEVGFKSQWFDKRLTANISAYYLDWSNQQLTQTAQAPRRDGVIGAVAFNTNIGKSQVKGAELEISARLSDDLTLRFGYALQDTQIKDFISDDQADLYITAADLAALNTAAPLPPLGTSATDPRVTARLAAVNALIALRGNARGNRLPRVPLHQLQLGLGYERSVSSNATFFARADLAYESKRYVQVDNLAWTGDTYNLNLRAGMKFDGLTVTAFMTNALNDRTPADVTRLLDPQQSFFHPALRAGEGTAAGGALSSITIRDFPVSAPRRRSFGITASYAF